MWIHGVEADPIVNLDNVTAIGIQPSQDKNKGPMILIAFGAGSMHLLDWGSSARCLSTLDEIAKHISGGSKSSILDLRRIVGPPTGLTVANGSDVRTLPKREPHES